MLKPILFMLGMSLSAGSVYAQYLDSSFAATGIAATTFTGNNEVAAKVLVQTDGKILAGGTTNGNAGHTQFVLARYDTAGVLDNTFGTAGKVITPHGGTDNQLTDMILLSSGKILAVGIAKTGSFSPWSTMLVRYNANGTVDNTFGTAGVVTTQVGTKCDAYNVKVQTDGKIIICGTQYDDQYYILVRYNADGTLDNSFGTAGVAEAVAMGTGMAIALQPDGKILVTGEFWGVGPHVGIARHNTDGSLDASFGFNGTRVIPSFYQDDLWGGYDVKVLPDGKILVPLFLNSNTIAQEPAIIRLNSDGMTDMSYGNGGYAFGPYSNFIEKGVEMAVQPDGKVLLAGHVQANNANVKDSMFVMRFDTSGAPDPTFGVNGRITARPDTGGTRISTIALQPNGKFLVAGSHGNANFKRFTVMRYKYVPDVNLSVPGTEPATHPLVLFPNPATEEISLQVTNQQPAPATITDISGRLITRQLVSSGKNAINIKTLPKGSYIISVEQNGTKHSALFEKL
ncbi:MAG: T9SS type A sorting domain-containing protein [Flavipsychrobacter sp.]|nr:T9SS type A sorting domain-containing protein [Flavipsychrobacter sp.]